MRVTDAYTHAAMLERVQRGNSRVAAASVAIASGRRIQTAADDPAAAVAVRRVDAEVHALAEGLARGRSATGPLEMAEAALGEAANILIGIQEASMQAGNGAFEGETIQAMAPRVHQLRAQLLAVANTEVAGRYVFAGRADHARPFEDTGAYSGDDGVREITIAPGLTVATTVAGDGPFAGADGGVNVFATVDAIVAALDAGDGEAARALYEDLETARAQITGARADVGARLNLLSESAAFGERIQEHLAAQRRDLVDVDVAKTAGELSLAQNTFQAAISVTQRLMEPTVLRMLM